VKKSLILSVIIEFDSFSKTRKGKMFNTIIDYRKNKINRVFIVNQNNDTLFQIFDVEIWVR